MRNDLLIYKMQRVYAGTNQINMRLICIIEIWAYFLEL